VRAHTFGVVRMARVGSRRRMASAACLAVPDGALKISMAEANIVEPQPVLETLRGVLEKAGALSGGRVGLVLPDSVARVLLVPTRELGKTKAADIDQVLRFRLKGRVPFEVRDARLTWTAADPRGETILVCMISQAILSGYEAVCQQAGLTPGLVELSGLALLRSVERQRAQGDRLLINWDEGYLSLFVSHKGWPVLVRTVVMDASIEDVLREVRGTLVYYKDNLSGQGLTQAIVRAGAGSLEELSQPLAEQLGFAPQGLNLVELADARQQALVLQALAGATACISGRAA
jgi:Tfp pilus assembly PilM family ATPase